MGIGFLFAGHPFGFLVERPHEKQGEAQVGVNGSVHGGASAYGTHRAGGTLTFEHDEAPPPGGDGARGKGYGRHSCR